MVQWGSTWWHPDSEVLLIRTLRIQPRRWKEAKWCPRHRFQGAEWEEEEFQQVGGHPHKIRIRRPFQPMETPRQ